jgi:hypothetical protein
MRVFLVLLCTLALACAVGGAQDENKSKKPAPKKKQVQSTQHAGAGGQKTKGKAKVSQQTTARGKGSHIGRNDGYVQQIDLASSAGAGTKKTKKLKGSATNTAAVQSRYKAQGKAKGAQHITANAAPPSFTNKSFGVAKTYKAQRFDLRAKARPTMITGVRFQENRRIEGSQKWQGSNYGVFRNYKSEWHDRGWWKSHSDNVVFVFGGWYAWNKGYWYPAWGYAPNAYYAYDGPIYAYNNLPPDQVIANVQAALQQQGYYQGEVDGLLGPQTRSALADYQRANGLAETAAIDQPTLESLGMT